MQRKRRRKERNAQNRNLLLLGCPVLEEILQYATPMPTLTLVCRRFHQAAWQCIGTWVEEQLFLPSSWLETQYQNWWTLQQRMNKATCRLGGTLPSLLHTWRQVVLERVARPLRQGTPARELARGRQVSVSLRRSGVVGVDYSASDLEEDYSRALSGMSWSRLLTKVWQLYRLFPALHQILAVGEHAVDVRVSSIAFTHTISGFPVRHLWDGAMLTVLPMLQYYTPGYTLHGNNLHRPHCPTPRHLVERLRAMADVVRRHPARPPSCSLLLLMTTMLRKPRPVLKLHSSGTPGRVPEHSVQIIHRSSVHEMWMHRYGKLVAILVVSQGSASLLPAAEPEHLAFFERLGEHWTEVMADYGRKTQLCGWCSRKIRSASGEGPLCGGLAELASYG